MWYCYERKTKGYKIGYAESVKGIKWKRKDGEVNFINQFAGEKEMRAYPNLINLDGNTLLL